MTFEISSNCANRNIVHDETSEPQSAEFLYTQTVFQKVDIESVSISTFFINKNR
jgi:hypothetical protein